MAIRKEILDELLKDYQNPKTCSVRAVSYEHDRELLQRPLLLSSFYAPRSGAALANA
jgi:hypothetical protein